MFACGSQVIFIYLQKQNKKMITIDEVNRFLDEFKGKQRSSASFIGMTDRKMSTRFSNSAYLHVYVNGSYSLWKVRTIRKDQ